MVSNLDSVIYSLVSSLWTDPFYRSILVDFNSDHEKIKTLYQYFKYSIDEGCRIGRVTIDTEYNSGASVWMLPNNKTILEKENNNKSYFIEKLLGPIGLNNYNQIIRYMNNQIEELIPKDAWYLSILGVNPKIQGKGIGRKLIEEIINEAKQNKTHCYIETFEEENHGFYKKMGFIELKTIYEPTTKANYVVMMN